MELRFRIHIQPHQQRRLSRMFTRIKSEGVEAAHAATRQELRGVITPGGRMTDRALPALAGDVIGKLGASVVAGLRGRPLLATAPTVGQGLVWNGTAWAPGTVAQATRWEPITNGDPDDPQIMFDAHGDVLMTEVPL